MWAYRHNITGTHFEFYKLPSASSYPSSWQTQATRHWDPTILVYPMSPSQRSQTLLNIRHTSTSSGNVLMLIRRGYRIPSSVIRKLLLQSQSPICHGLTLNSLSVSLPPCKSFRNVGLLRPRMFWSIGSSVLNVLDSWLDLTMQTKTLPKQYPALKNEVCDEILLARFKPAPGSL